MKSNQKKPSNNQFKVDETSGIERLDQILETFGLKTGGYRKHAALTFFMLIHLIFVGVESLALDLFYLTKINQL